MHWRVKRWMLFNTHFLSVATGICGDLLRQMPEVRCLKWRVWNILLTTWSFLPWWKSKWQNTPWFPCSSGIFTICTIWNNVVVWECTWHWVLRRAHIRNTRVSAPALPSMSSWGWKMSTKLNSWKCCWPPGTVDVCTFSYLSHTFTLTMIITKVQVRSVYSGQERTRYLLSWVVNSLENTRPRTACGHGCLSPFIRGWRWWQRWMRAMGGNPVA